MVARDRPPFVDARVGWLVDLLAVERIVLKSADEIFESKQSFPGTQHAGSPTGLNDSASHLGGRHAACGRRRTSCIGCFRAGVNQLDGHPRTAARNRRCGPIHRRFRARGRTRWLACRASLSRCGLLEASGLNRRSDGSPLFGAIPHERFGGGQEQRLQ